MKTSHYGPCSLYCGACGATDCGGCQSDRIDKSIEKCKFRRCSKEKGLEFCCFCGEYPCKELHTFMTDKWPHHWTMEPNLTFIKEHGKKAWLEAQERQWSCADCGARIMWYQKECPCGFSLDAWPVPD
ncbi:MAG: DUF3795 domain-containing protein [Sedimentisphaerales bacterium]|nr:DUF3795 domain-containing protein [Sedimentisphaerales bacterium]